MPLRAAVQPPRSSLQAGSHARPTPPRRRRGSARRTAGRGAGAGACLGGRHRNRFGHRPGRAWQFRRCRGRVEQLGGTVVHSVGVLDGVVADVPAGSVAEIGSAPGVASVSVDDQVELHAEKGLAEGWEESGGAIYDGDKDLFLHHVTKAIGAHDV